MQLQVQGLSGLEVCWVPKFKIPIGPKLKKSHQTFYQHHQDHHFWVMDSLSSDGILFLVKSLLPLYDHDPSLATGFQQLLRFYSVAVITSGSDPSSSKERAWTVRATPVRFRVGPTSMQCIAIIFFPSILIISVCFSIFCDFSSKINFFRCQHHGISIVNR
jgi:hypothetical protein